jgi:hypothetical protein
VSTATCGCCCICTVYTCCVYYVFDACCATHVAVYCHPLQEHTVSDVEVVKQLIEEANHRRSVGSTAANADSSRSHSIMQFALKRFIAGGAHCRLVGIWCGLQRPQTQTYKRST